MHNYDGLFSKNSNYKKTFSEVVEKMTGSEMELVDRIPAINALLEAYFLQTGELPDSAQLERLADFILREDLKDRHPDKVTNTEYPFLSAGQIKLRKRREFPCDTGKMTGNIKHKMNGRKKTFLRPAGS